MFSYWEKTSFLQYQHIVIGAGIVGLSVAIELRFRYPKDRILILERGMMSTGASSRNAGFACMGSVTELLSDLKTMSEDDVFQLFNARKKGLELLRQRLGDNQINYTTEGSYELINELNLSAIHQIPYLNELLYPITKTNTFRLTNNRISDFGFNPTYTKAIIENTCEGALDTGKMLRALCDLALEMQIEIKTNAEVSHFEESSQKVKVMVPDQIRKDNWAFECNKLYICTNAFTKSLLPEENIIPGRGQVLITKPINNLPFKGIFHFDEGYYYFRNIDNRLLFGGGRNLDFETEKTTTIALNHKIQLHLLHLIKTVILPKTNFEIDQTWSGIMAFGNTKQPIVKSFSEKVYGAFRMGGMGVALGSEVAQRLADMAKS
jgi:glycine/D-amino acid oxidase-like deaminating enzyme